MKEYISAILLFFFFNKQSFLLIAPYNTSESFFRCSIPLPAKPELNSTRPVCIFLCSFFLHLFKSQLENYSYHSVKECYGPKDFHPSISPQLSRTASTDSVFAHTHTHTPHTQTDQTKPGETVVLNLNR